MKLYEVNQQIRSLLDQLEVDPETGEILFSSDDIMCQLNALDIERERILRYLAKVVLETRAEVTAHKNEEERLAKRRRALERKEACLMQILDRECAGQKTDLGVATLRYRQTTRVDVRDAEKALNWLIGNNHPQCIRVKEPEVDKTAVKRLLTQNVSIPGVELVTSQSCSLR